MTPAGFAGDTLARACNELDGILRTSLRAFDAEGPEMNTIVELSVDAVFHLRQGALNGGAIDVDVEEIHTLEPEDWI